MATMRGGGGVQLLLRVFLPKDCAIQPFLTSQPNDIYLLFSKSTFYIKYFTFLSFSEIVHGVGAIARAPLPYSHLLVQLGSSHTCVIVNFLTQFSKLGTKPAVNKIPFLNNNHLWTSTNTTCITAVSAPLLGCIHS